VLDESARVITIAPNFQTFALKRGLSKSRRRFALRARYSDLDHILKYDPEKREAVFRKDRA